VREKKNERLGHINWLISLFILTSIVSSVIMRTPIGEPRKDSQVTSFDVLKTSYESVLGDNGSAISGEQNQQTTPEICSDGAGGAIIIWDDTRDRNSDIYGQRINSSGDYLWGDNGTAICTSRNPTLFGGVILQTINDGAGGAIVVWNDASSAVYAQKVNSTGDPQWNPNGVLVVNDYVADLRICSDEGGGVIASWDNNKQPDPRIYAQRINATGDAVWTTNGVAAAYNNYSKLTPRICSDGAGGAIINWRHNTNSYMYAQRINSTGGREWGDDGLTMTSSTQGQYFNEIESDGAGGAYIVWCQDMSSLSIIAQHVNSSGAITWPSGRQIGYGWAFSKDQYHPELCSDGAGGVFIIWKDLGYYDIHVQRLRSNGNLDWDYPQEKFICLVSGNEYRYEISYDGFGGALIVWPDYRSGEWDIYTQIISASGELRWKADGKLICSASFDQESPEIINDEDGGAFITWQDYRNGDWDVYGQYIEDEGPTSNSPADITTSIASSVMINWRLYDDYLGGEYRVIANATNGNLYVWQNWTSWSNNTPINIPINRTSVGSFNYTIEYQDNIGNYGDPSTVIVTLIADNPPTSSHPLPISTGASGSEVITWILYDDLGEGQYRVLANSTSGNFYVWRDWTSWTNNSPNIVGINRTAPGSFIYSIEYYDMHNQYGISDMVDVNIINEPPTSYPTEDIAISVGETLYLEWYLYDDFGGGLYHVIKTDSQGTSEDQTGWRTWRHGRSILPVPVDSSVAGIFNYTIEFHDYFNLDGISDTITVTIVGSSPGIPFGNYYLIFTILGVVSLIIVKKRKLTYKS
jgi:hypothetical protein